MQLDAGAGDDLAFAGVGRDIAGMQGDLKVVTWMQVATFAGTVAIVLRLFIYT